MTLMKRKNIIYLGQNLPRVQHYIVFAIWVGFAAIALFLCLRQTSNWKWFSKFYVEVILFYPSEILIYKPSVLLLIFLNIVFGMDLKYLVVLSLFSAIMQFLIG